MINIFYYLLVLVLFSCKKEKESTKAVFGTITETVYASGFIKADGQYNVFAPVNGFIKKIGVKSGDSVKVGQELIWIENQTATLGSENARLMLGLARDNFSSSYGIVKDLENAVQVAKEKIQLDSSLYNKQVRLLADNIGSKLEMEQRKLAFISSKAAYETAKDKLALTKKQLETEIKRAENNLKLSEKQQGDFIIKSELDGRIYAINKELGELVNPQTALGVIGSIDHFFIELHVDEFDIVKLKLGQQILVTMDSYKNSVFEAEIIQIDPIMNLNSRSFNIKARFIKAPETLYPNLSVQANIIIQKKDRVLTIPTKYITEFNKVIIEKNEKKEVVIGLQDYLNTEIISGLDTNETIYLPKK